METNYLQDFDYVIQTAKSVGKPARVAIAGAAGVPMILEGAMMARKEGIAEPVLLGDTEKIKETLAGIGEDPDSCEIISVPDGVNMVQYTIECIKAGKADILMRGNTHTRDFLLPVINKSNHLLKDKLFTQVELVKIPGMSKAVAVSDVTILVTPSQEQLKEVIRNMVKALNIAGVMHPNIALLSLVEVPSFHMNDTIQASNLVFEHGRRPIADCNLVGPISYDLIVSKESAQQKKYDCEYCGDFDGIVVPNLMVGNVMIKVLQKSMGAEGFGIIIGGNIPIAITSRSDSAQKAFLSIAATRVTLDKLKKKEI